MNFHISPDFAEYDPKITKVPFQKATFTHNSNFVKIGVVVIKLFASDRHKSLHKRR